LSFIFNRSLAFDIIGPNPSYEYREIGPFIGNFLYTFRLSLGDMSFDNLTDEMPPWKHYIFWFTWFAYVVFGLLIILNFIIAEVGNSYGVVNENLQRLVFKERA